MVFKPVADRTRWEGLVAIGWLLLIDGLLIAWAMQRPTDWLRFTLILLAILSIPVIAYVGYRTWAAFSLEYWVDRNGLQIRWAYRRRVVPLQSIQRIIEGGIEESSRPQWYEWPLPGLRRAQVLGLAHLHLYTTRPLQESLLLDTGAAVLAISPQWQARFLEHLQESYRLGPVTLVNEEEASDLSPSWLENRTVSLVLLTLGLIGVLALFGNLMIHYPTLPNLLTFRYNSEGLPEVVREKNSLFILPAIGLLTWLTNGLWGLWMVLRNQPTGAYMLWGGAIVVEIFSLLALNSLLP